MEKEILKPFENEGIDKEKCDHTMGGWGNEDFIICSGCGKKL